MSLSLIKFILDLGFVLEQLVVSDLQWLGEHRLNGVIGSVHICSCYLYLTEF